MGGSTKTTQKQQATQSNTIDPWSKGLLTGNYDTAKGNAAILGQPYTGQLTAGFTPTQLQAQGILSGVGTDPAYAANNNTALNGVGGILGTTPNTTITANPVQASTIAGTDLSPYLNPYTQNVIDTTIADQERARQVAGVNDAAKATAAGAFGGSRSGVLSSLTNGEYDRNTASLLAGLNQTNYNNAMGLAGQDVTAKNNMGQFNAGQDLTAQQNSVANDLAARNQQLAAAGQFADLNNNGLTLAQQQGGILGAVGDAQQQQQQTELSNAYNAWLQGKQMTVQQQNLLNSALGMIPVQQTVNSNSNGTKTQSENPGLVGILGGIGTLAKGIGALGI